MKFKYLIFVVGLIICFVIPVNSQNQELDSGPITHIVICWLDSSLTDNQIDEVIQETKKLKKIPGLVEMEIGKSVESDREVVDDSFTFAVTMKFKSKKEMNDYLSHNDHIKFVTEILKPKLSKYIVYDFEN